MHFRSSSTSERRLPRNEFSRTNATAPPRKPANLRITLASCWITAGVRQNEMKCQHTSTVIQTPCNLELQFNRIYKTNLLWWLWKATELVPTWAGVYLFCAAPSLFKSLEKHLVGAYWVTHKLEAGMLMIFISVLHFDWIVLDRVWVFIWGIFCSWFLVAFIFFWLKKKCFHFSKYGKYQKLKEKH